MQRSLKKHFPFPVSNSFVSQFSEWLGYLWVLPSLGMYEVKTDLIVFFETIRKAVWCSKDFLIGRWETWVLVQPSKVLLSASTLESTGLHFSLILWVEGWLLLGLNTAECSSSLRPVTTIFVYHYQRVGKICQC